MDCIFCRIISGEVETWLLYEDEACVAFLDINPATAGHTLVVPKQHADDLLGMSEPQARAVMSATWRVSRLLDQRLTPDGRT